MVQAIHISSNTKRTCHTLLTKGIQNKTTSLCLQGENRASYIAFLSLKYRNVVISWTVGLLESICVHLAFQLFHLQLCEWEEERGMLFCVDYKWNWLLNMDVLSIDMRCLVSCHKNDLNWSFYVFHVNQCTHRPTHMTLVVPTTDVLYMLQRYERCQITTWGHDPSILSTSNLLLTLQECLSHSAVLVQTYSLSADTGATRHLSFPLSKGNKAV